MPPVRSLPDSPKQTEDPSYEVVIRGVQRSWYGNAVAFTLLLATVVLSLHFVEFLDGDRWRDSVGPTQDLLKRALPPSFTHWKRWLRPLLDTVAMSIAGTFIAIVLSLPLGFLAARNTTPHRIVYGVARTILNGLRAVPELFMGMIFVVAVGFGPLPGVLALGLHSAGMVGKFYAEIIEHVDEAPVEAARASGARSFQVILHGIMPQVVSKMADVSVYRWEHNFRASTILGMVGAGGIGFQLDAARRMFDYQEVTAILIVILGCVTIVDGISSLVRRRFQ
jgi:phosphonate transport system permease protein